MTFDYTGIVKRFLSQRLVKIFISIVNCSYIDRCINSIPNKCMLESSFYTTMICGGAGLYGEVYSFFSSKWIRFYSVYLYSSGLWKECYTDEDCYFLIGQPLNFAATMFLSVAIIYNVGALIFCLLSRYKADIQIPRKKSSENMFFCSSLFGSIGVLIFTYSLYSNLETLETYHLDNGFFWILAGVAFNFTSGIYSKLSVIEMREMEKRSLPNPSDRYKNI